MEFDQEKKQFLKKKDKSRKGSIDKPILPLVKLINSCEDYYTTSSCSGRIILITKPVSGRKCDSEWLFVSHKKASLSELKKALNDLPEEPLWFRQEALILHVRCRTMKAAVKLLRAARDVSFKRSGIISDKRRIVEITSTEKVDTIIAENGKLLVDEAYLNVLLREANLRMDANSDKINKLYKRIKELIKKSG